MRNFITITIAILLLIGSCAWAQSARQADEPIAVVNGTAIHEGDLREALRPQMRQIRQQEYEAKKRALEGVIEKKLLEAEAAKKGVTVEQIIQQEIASKIAEPSDAEIEAYYLGQGERANRPLAEVKAQLRQALKQAKQQKAREDYVNSLRERAEVAVLLRPPKIEVGYEAARLRGDAKAPVVIVEFSDFQCPFCQRVQPALKQVLAKYGDKVSLAFRDYPLRRIHPQAQAAAEAARCAGEQGKFWEYHDALYGNFGKLDAASLNEHAKTLGLNETQFAACRAEGKYRAQIEKDLQDGIAAGVSGTPGFFVNGVFLSGAQPASAFEKVIDAELAALRYDKKAAETTALAAGNR